MLLSICDDFLYVFIKSSLVEHGLYAGLVSLVNLSRMPRNFDGIALS